MSHQISLESSDVSFACEPGQSVLDAALKAGVDEYYPIGGAPVLARLRDPGAHKQGSLRRSAARPKPGC